jgi:hypothetical protein
MKMHDWIESQLNQILTQSFDLEDEYKNGNENERLFSVGRILQLEFMLESEMIKQYLTKNEIECLTLSLQHIDANLFCRR